MKEQELSDITDFWSRTETSIINNYETQYDLVEDTKATVLALIDEVNYLNAIIATYADFSSRIPVASMRRIRWQIQHMLDADAQPYWGEFMDWFDKECGRFE